MVNKEEIKELLSDIDLEIKTAHIQNKVDSNHLKEYYGGRVSAFKQVKEWIEGKWLK